MAGPVLVVITAGGVGKRYGKPYPKQLEKIEGQSVLMRTASFFEQLKPERAVVTAPAHFLERFQEEVEPLSYPVDVIRGGAERFHSVQKAVQFLGQGPYPEDSVILIHDGVRPFLNRKTVEMVISQTRQHGAAVPYIPVTGTVRRLRENTFQETVERKELAIMTTPQGVLLGLLMRCYESQPMTFPDESTMLHAEGIEAVPVEDWPLNIKLTSLTDLKALRALWGIR